MKTKKLAFGSVRITDNIDYILSGLFVSIVTGHVITCILLIII